jgi:aerobic carbon-monoxide dehydrogenase large subunit
MKGELALTKDGRITAMRASILSDQGAFFADAQPTKFRAGLFHICTGSYDIPAAHVTAKGAFTNKAPGGVAYRCSFRVTEASYLVERLAEDAAWRLGIDPAEFRRKNFIDKDQFPYLSPTGFVYDSGDYHAALDEAMDSRLRRLAPKQAEGRLPTAS